MAEATVTLKLSPSEFDLVREALVNYHSDVIRDTATSLAPLPAERQKLRAKALLIADLGKKLDA